MQWSSAFTHKISILTFSTFLVACSEMPAEEYSDSVTDNFNAALMEVADNYLRGVQSRSPTLSYYVNYPLERHDGLIDNSPDALVQWQAAEDDYLSALMALDYAPLKGTRAGVLYAQMQEKLEADIGVRICKQELWDINHMSAGMHSRLGDIAKNQPVGTPELRDQAIARWVKIAGYFHQEIANLKQGLSEGYSAPKPVVARVLAQVNGLIELSEDQSPLYDVVRRDDDAAFHALFKGVIEGEVVPALRTYSKFLSKEYMPAARTRRALSENPNGAACFEALYRQYTTIKRSAQGVHDLGRETVDRYAAQVVELGQEVYGLDDMAAILKRNVDHPDNRFETLEEMHSYYEAVVLRVEAGSVAAFEAMPKGKIEVKPYPDYLAGTGVSARYERGGTDRSAVFRYDPTGLSSQSKGGAEIVSVHEGYPGHHMQIALVQDQAELHPIQRLTRHSAFIEGWARYAEALTEELGLYETDFAKITRRAWPARGMVVDSGIHVLGWSEEQALAFLRESGRFEGEGGIRMIDRVAAIPAQLTSYDSGAIEIFALRSEAQRALGAKFDLKAFHTIILKNGVVPMWLLREQVEDWIARSASNL
ncbi:DUF885 domain-containing protein [Kordiimonas aquimaris]|uniref:DUF885 domain-containing protein n=1 Tax=Kordiimonas aquimaris TaxID=707591 RepID=UPI0021D26786|nr:DUF885 domain-containing protein [Kordiimonas aquimaris]